MLLIKKMLLMLLILSKIKIIITDTETGFRH